MYLYVSLVAVRRGRERSYNTCVFSSNIYLPQLFEGEASEEVHMVCTYAVKMSVGMLVLNCIQGLS